MVRLVKIMGLAGLLAAAAQAQTPPVRSGTSAGIAKAPLAPAGSADAPVARPVAAAPARKRAPGDRPSYNLNEGPNKIGPFAGGQEKPRPKNG